MRDSLQRWMRVGILQPAAFPRAGTLEALRQIARDPFFRAVETTSAESDSTRQEAADLLRAVGLEVDFDAGSLLYAHGASLCSLAPSNRAAAVEMVRQAIPEASALGAARLNLVSGRDPGAADRAAARAALVESILELYASARSSGPMELGLKLADRAVDKRFLIGPTRDGIDIARRVREHQPGFGLVLNLGHLPLLGEDPAVAVREAAPYLARVHIANCIRRCGDIHPRFGVADGEIGVAELARFLRALIEVGYLAPGGRNVVAFEVRPAPDDDPLATIAHSQRSLYDAWVMA